jgi:hypothetical protein
MEEAPPGGDLIFTSGEYAQAMREREERENARQQALFLDSIPSEVRDLPRIPPASPQHSTGSYPYELPEAVEGHAGDSTTLPEALDHRQLPRGNSACGEYDLTTPDGRVEERKSLYRKSVECFSSTH